MTSCFQDDDDDDVTLTWFGLVEGGRWNVPPTDYDSEASTDITYGRGGEFTIVLIQPTGSGGQPCLIMKIRLETMTNKRAAIYSLLYCMTGGVLRSTWIHFLFLSEAVKEQGCNWCTPPFKAQNSFVLIHKYYET